MTTITTLEQLESIYGQPIEQSLVKEAGSLTPEYRALIGVSPFLALATTGPEGLDCSPRGEPAGFIRVVDDKTLMLPDRRGNNRADSLRNIIRDPRVALLFLIPGVGLTLRVIGKAELSIEPELLQSFAVGEQAPRSVIVIHIDSVYFQCPKAIMRSELWNPERHVDPATLPTPGQIVGALTSNVLGGEEFDKAWPERAKAGMW